jgi:hypothetical protein
MTRDPGPPATVAAPPPPSGPARRRSRRRTWLYRGLAVLLVLGLFAGCEFALRLLGVGESLQLVIPAPDAGEELPYQLNPHVDRVYFGSQDMFGPEPRRFALPRPRGTLRIVFLGASTVNGFPYATEISFPRRVEHLLEAQRPGTDVEVLNAAVTAINSFEIADLARQCLACEPDLVVVHTGHNEFFGPGGPASTELQLSPGWIDVAFAMRRWRLSQCLAALVPAGAPSSEHPLQSLPRLTDVRWGDATYEQAATNLRVNLRRTLDTLRGAGVPVVLSTVACNLRDQGPIRTVWPEAVTPEQKQRCQALIAEAEQLAALQQPESALGRLREAEGIAREVAHLQFRVGQALESLGRRDEARAISTVAASVRRACSARSCARSRQSIARE